MGLTLIGFWFKFQ